MVKVDMMNYFFFVFICSFNFCYSFLFKSSFTYFTLARILLSFTFFKSFFIKSFIQQNKYKDCFSFNKQSNYLLFTQISAIRSGNLIQQAFIKGYLHQKAISQNVSSEAQVKKLFIA